MALAVIPEEEIEALAERVAGAAGRTQAPLADRPGGIAGLLEPLGQRDRLGGNRLLSLGLDRAVVADVGVAGVQARHQHAPRRRADGRAAVALREADSLGGHAVQGRRADFLLSVAPQLAVSQIVGQDEHDVGGAVAAGASSLLAGACQRGRSGSGEEDANKPV